MSGDDDAAGGDGLPAAEVVGSAAAVVVDDPAGVPDLDAELVGATAAGDVTVGRSEHERVARLPVHRPLTLELSLRAGDDEPFVARTGEGEVAGLEVICWRPEGLDMLARADCTPDTCR